MREWQLHAERQRQMQQGVGRQARLVLSHPLGRGGAGARATLPLAPSPPRTLSPPQPQPAGAARRQPAARGGGGGGRLGLRVRVRVSNPNPNPHPNPSPSPSPSPLLTSPSPPPLTLTLTLTLNRTLTLPRWAQRWSSRRPSAAGAREGWTRLCGASTWARPTWRWRSIGHEASAAPVAPQQPLCPPVAPLWQRSPSSPLWPEGGGAPRAASML